MGHDDNRKSCLDPARLETLCMSGTFLHGSWEVSVVPDATSTSPHYQIYPGAIQGL